MWLRSIKLYRIRDGLQRLLGCSDNAAADLFRRLNSFRPLLFDATMDAQRIYGTHEVNLAAAPFSGNQDLLHKVAETRKVPGEVAKRFVKLRDWPCLNSPNGHAAVSPYVVVGGRAENMCS
jgi:hypothetical protein